MSPGFSSNIDNIQSMSTNTPSRKTYDHRLRNLVYTTKDVSLALDLGVPRSTAYGWIRNEPPEVVNVLSVLAQRLGKVFSSASTWHKLIKYRGWLRPRKRLHPAKLKVGIRTERPDEKRHIDTSVIKLLDGTKAYIHGVELFLDRSLVHPK